MSESTPFAEPAKQWLRLHLRWEVGGGIMGFVCAVAVNTCWALSEYRAAECCTALCLIVLLLWVWVWNLPKLARAIVAALTIGAGIWVVSQLEGARTHALAKKSAQVGFLSEKTRSSIFIHANQLMAARSVFPYQMANHLALMGWRTDSATRCFYGRPAHTDRRIAEATPG